MVPNFAIVFISNVKTFSCKFSSFLPFHAIPSVQLLMVLFSFVQSELSSLGALLRIHKYFLCNLQCMHPVCFPYRQMSILYMLNIQREYVYLHLLWIIFQNYFLHPSIFLIQGSRSI